jgi:hypothetical protein
VLMPGTPEVSSPMKKSDASRVTSTVSCTFRGTSLSSVCAAFGDAIAVRAGSRSLCNYQNGKPGFAQNAGTPK